MKHKTMDEQFDKKLTNHIREVFDNYEHPGAERGWEQLRKKFPAKQRNNKVAWLWWSSAAAIIIICFGVGLWYNTKPNTVNNLAVKPKVKTQQVNEQPKAPGNNQSNTTAPVTTGQTAVAKNSTPVFNNPTIPSIHYQIPATNPNTIPANTSLNTGAQQPQITANSAITTIAQNGQPAQAGIVTPVIDSQKVISNVAKQPQLAANTQVQNNQVQANNNVTANTVAKKQPKTMADMFADENLNKPAKRNDPDKQNSKKVNFSIYAATYFNYAEGSANQVNAGAGFTSDFRLSKNLKLSTGVALAQNSLSYASAPPQSPSANNFVASAPAAKQQEALFATSAVFPVFKNYNASLVGLDIPINIKYEFNPEKTDAYISAGLSSGTFIDESYTYRYGYGNGTSNAVSTTAEEQTTHNSFNNFYFGKTLNFSFGVGYPVGGNRLIVEPFVKYPLGGLGAQDIRFGAGGVNLKFSFRTQKK